MNKKKLINTLTTLTSNNDMVIKSLRKSLAGETDKLNVEQAVLASIKSNNTLAKVLVEVIYSYEGKTKTNSKDNDMPDIFKDIFK